MVEAVELRRVLLDLAGQLHLYKSNLGDLPTTLEQIHIMMLARQAAWKRGDCSGAQFRRGWQRSSRRGNPNS